jgi:hypothetical protein
MKRLQHLKVTTKKESEKGTFDPNKHGTPVDSSGHGAHSRENKHDELDSSEDSPNKYGTVVDTGGHGEHAKVENKKTISEAIINLSEEPAFTDPSKPKPKRFGEWVQENDNSHLGSDDHAVESELHSKHNYYEYPHRNDISQYTSNSNDLNRYLLGRHKSRETTEHDTDIVEWAKNLDKATRFKELGHELHTYHGTRFHPGVEAAKHPKNRLYLPCFTSTSLSKPKAHGFTHVIGHDETDGKAISHIIHFHHKENNKGTYIGKYSQHEYEKEFLVPRNTSVKINPEPTKTVDSSGNHVHIWHATDITHHAIRDGLSKTERELAKKIKADPVYGSILKGDNDEISNHIKNGKFTPEHKKMVANDPKVDSYFKRHVFSELANKNENLTKEELADHVTNIPDNYTHLNNEKIEHIIANGNPRSLGEHAANISQKHIKAIIDRGYGTFPSGLIKNRRLTSAQFHHILNKNPGSAGNLQGVKLTKAIKSADDGSTLTASLADNRHLTPEHLTHLIPKLSYYGLSDLGYNSANHDKLTKQHIDMLLNHPEGVPSGIHGKIHQFKNATHSQLNTAMLKYGNNLVVKHPNFKITSDNARNILSGDHYYLPDKVKQEAAKALKSQDVDYLMTHGGKREAKISIIEHSDKVKPEHLMSLVKAHPYSESLADMISKHKAYDGETALKHIQLGKDEHESYHIEAALKSGKLSRAQLRKLDLKDHSSKMEDLRKETLRKLAFKEINDKIDKEKTGKKTAEPEEAPVEAPKEEDANSIRLHNTLDKHLEVQKNEKDRINPQPMPADDYYHLANHINTMGMHHITKLLKLKGYPISKMNAIKNNPNVTREHLKTAARDSESNVRKYALETLLKLGIK